MPLHGDRNNALFRTVPHQPSELAHSWDARPGVAGAWCGGPSKLAQTLLPGEGRPALVEARNIQADRRGEEFAASVSRVMASANLDASSKHQPR